MKRSLGPVLQTQTCYHGISKLQYPRVTSMGGDFAQIFLV